MNRDTYIKHHEEIRELMSNIEKLIKEKQLEKNADIIARQVAVLAGKVSIHLSLEDKYLYPKLAESTEEKIRSLALRYQKQMGGIASNFVAYKDKYNTKPEVLEGAAKIEKETEAMFKELRNRIEKEEQELYQYIG